jgi:TolA-binding protein
MKAKERHHLKQNEFAATTQRVVGAVKDNARRTVIAVVVAVAVLAAVGGYLVFRNSRANEAGAKLGIAMSISQAQIAPASTLPGAVQPPNTYPTEKARSEAALKAYQDVIASFPSTDAALTAKYESAGELLDLGRAAEAEALFNEVIAANSATYTPMARLGIVQVRLASGKYDDAAKLLTDLSADRDGALPVDGVLMQLAQTYVKAGKADDARAAYKRVVDEFADSTYAGEARQKLASLN